MKSCAMGTSNEAYSIMVTGAFKLPMYIGCNLILISTSLLSSEKEKKGLKINIMKYIGIKIILLDMILDILLMTISI